MNEKEDKQALQEVHEGICITYVNRDTLAKQMQWSRYFWLTMEMDCVDYFRKCHKCQVYGDKINVPSTPLFNMTSHWAFDMWGLDVIGPINPKTNNKLKVILLAIEYFTEWVEVNSYTHVTQKVVKRFNKNDLICHYSLLEKLITNNAQNFNRLDSTLSGRLNTLSFLLTNPRWMMISRQLIRISRRSSKIC